MSTIFQSLKSISNYPIPSAVIEDTAEDFGLDAQQKSTADIRKGRNYMLAKARVYDFLSDAPNISQSGITYTFSDVEKKSFKAKAESIRESLGETDMSDNNSYGYQGENF